MAAIAIGSVNFPLYLAVNQKEFTMRVHAAPRPLIASRTGDDKHSHIIAGSAGSSDPSIIASLASEATGGIAEGNIVSKAPRMYFVLNYASYRAFLWDYTHALSVPSRSATSNYTR